MDTSIGIKLSATGAQQVKTDLLSVSNGVDLLGNAAQRVSTNAAAMVASLGAGLVAGLGASAFASIIKGSVDSAAALHDLSIQTGATVESLSALGSIGKYTDTSAQQIGEAMNKLARNMAGATEESKGTGKALQAIGLDFAKFKDLAPEEQMQTAAKALGQFADGSGKSAAAMALFGKEGAKMLPFLKDLGVAGELTAKVTADQAAAADDFADNLTRLQSSGDAWKKELAMGMIPALNLGLQAFVDVTNGAGGLRDEVRNLSKDGSINNWTKSAITGVTYVIDVFSGLKAVIKSLGSYWGALAATAVQTLGTVGDAVAKAMKGDFKGAVSDVMGIGGKVKEVWSGLGDDLADIWGEQTLGSKIRARMKDIDALGGAAEKAKPKLNFTNVLDSDGKADNSAAKEALSQQISYYEELQAVAVQSLQREQESLASAHAAGLLSDAKYYAAKRDLAANTNIDQQALIELEIESVQASTVASKDKVAAINRYNVELTKLKEQQLSIVQKYNDEIDAAEAKQAIATIKAYADQVEGAQQAAVALNAQAQAQLDHNATIGLGVQALADLEAAKLQDQAASLDRLAIEKDLVDWSGQLGDAYRAQAKALRELASAKTLGAAKQVVADLAKEQANEALRMADQIGQGLANSLMQGGKSAWEYIKGLFRTRLVMEVGGVLSGGITGLLGGGASAANAATSAATSAGTSALGSAAGSMLFGGASLTAIGSSIGTGIMATLGGQSITAAGMTGVSAGLQTGAAIPYVTAAVAALAAVGLFRTTKQVGSGLTGTLGEGDINSYALNRKSGYLFGGPDYSIADQGVAAQSAALQTAFATSRAAMVSMADTLGLGSEAIKSFTTSIGNDLIHPDTGGLGLKLDGLTADQAATKVQEALASANEAMAQTVLSSSTLTGWMARLAAAQTTATTTLQVLVDYPNKLLEAVGTSRDALVQTFAQGLMTGDAATAGQSVANQLVASIEQTMMGSASAQIFDIINRGIVTPMIDAMLTGQSLTTALSQASLDAVVAKATATAQAMGAVLNDPKFIEGMNRLRAVTGQALSTAGAGLAYTPQYQLANTEAEKRALYGSNYVEQTAGSVGQAVADLAQRFADATQALAETHRDLSVDLLRAQGNEASARAMERSKYISQYADLAEAERTLLAARYDQNTAISDQIDAIGQANAVGDERKNLERQLLDLVGDAAAVRALELSALDESNRPLLSRIHALTDEKTAADQAARAADALASSFASMYSAADSLAARVLAAPDLQAYQYGRLAQRGNAAVGVDVFSAQLLQSLGIDAIKTAVLDFVAGNHAPEAKQAIMQLSADLIELKQSALDAADATASAVKAAEASRLDQQLGLQRQFVDLTGDSAGIAALRELEIAQLNGPLNQALQRHIYTLQDQKTATEAAAEAATKTTDNAYSAVERAVAAQRKAVETQVQSAQSLVQEVGNIFDTLKSNVRDLFGEVDSTQQYQAQQARAFIGLALTGARAGAGLPDGGDLADAISAARSGLDAQTFTSQSGADYAKLVLANELRDLQDISSTQLTEAELHLKVAEDQLAALDGTLSAAKDQLDALRGVDNSVISVEAALGKFAAAVLAEKSGAGGAAPSAASLTEQAAQAYGASVVAYSARALASIDVFLAEIAKLPGKADPAFVQKQLAYFGSVYADVPAFAGGGWHAGGWAMVGERGPELAYMPPAQIYTAPQTTAMLGGGNTERLERLVEGLTAEVQRLQALVGQGNQHTGQLAEQFDSVTAGGNSMAMEALT